MLPAFDATVTLGNVIEVTTIAAGGVWFLFRMGASVRMLESEVSLMQREIVKIGDVLTRLAVADARLNNVEQDIRDMRNEGK